MLYFYNQHTFSIIYLYYCVCKLRKVKIFTLIRFHQYLFMSFELFVKSRSTKNVTITTISVGILVCSDGLHGIWCYQWAYVTTLSELIKFCGRNVTKHVLIAFVTIKFSGLFATSRVTSKFKFSSIIT